MSQRARFLDQGEVGSPRDASSRQQLVRNGAHLAPLLLQNISAAGRSAILSVDK